MSPWEMGPQRAGGKRSRVYSHEGSMIKLRKILSRFGFPDKREQVSEEEAERLRVAFKARYHHFKLLLSANNKALELMSEMEGTLRGSRPFGMSFIRANSTAVSVNVYRIIQNLMELAPGKYDELLEPFKEIRGRINQVLSRRVEIRGEKLVLFLDEVEKEHADQVGNKMANVGEIKNRIFLPVPPGFVVTAAAYHAFFEHSDLQAEIDRLLQSISGEQLDQLFTLSAQIQQRIIQAPLPEEVEAAMLEAYKALEAETRPGVRVSMRSSALGEDGGEMSFAGQYRSELNVAPESIVQVYKEIVASKYSAQAISYRLNRGVLDEDIAMCVGCMVMVNAESGGVIYSSNPLNIRDDSIRVNAVWGLAKSIVDGSADADVFVVSRTDPPEIVSREIRPKEKKFVCYAEEGVCRLEVAEEERFLPSLRDEQVLELAAMALKLEQHYDTPVDVEWAIDEQKRIYILQCRPLKALDASATVREPSGIDPLESDVLLQGGEIASGGVACGEVFVVRKAGDALLFPEGGILVAPQALPRIAPLLNRASGVITEQGSVAGHLANVAREVGVPALFGVRGATEVLRNGQTVTLDADGLRIHRGRVETLLQKARPRKNLMEGSRVHRILQEVIEHIAPLNLLDPDSLEFRPKNCKTYHDITRFCHEKAVWEMFNFGKENQFTERASKQLFTDVAMQWWFINLDDGFHEDVKDKFVLLDNIACIPFWPLWEGINAVPWAGPPPVDTKGFMSVLLEASANPALDPSMPSQYANRNYFMISKNFLSLSSRFGFHFCTIETLVSERVTENYISFQFKGGAADFQRRIRRARFVSGILEEFGFRAELKEDGVFARIEGYGEEVMKEKLKVLGYLIMHTRQLDMIMSNDASYWNHRSKIIDDIKTKVIPPLGGCEADAHVHL